MFRAMSPRAVAVVAAGSLIAGVLAVTAATPARSAQPGDAARFDTWVGYDVGLRPAAAAMGDFNRDGQLDVVWGTHAGTISVSMNIGDGSLAPAVAYATSAQTHDLQTADLDGDGDVDIVGAGSGVGGDDDIDLYLNKGSGTFVHSRLVGGSEPKNLALADLDGDGDTDLVMAHRDSRTGGMAVLLNNGDATFAPRVFYPVGPQTYEVVLADFDGDDVLDAAATSFDPAREAPHQLSILRGNDDGTFRPDPSPQAVDEDIIGRPGEAAIDAGDLDGDGDIDLAVGGRDNSEVGILRNNGIAKFTPTTYGGIFGTLDVHVVDADVDGDLDVLSVGGGIIYPGRFLIHRNKGNGTLAAPESVITSINPLGFAVGDLTGDDRVDVAIANYDSGLGSTHLQRGDGTFAAPLDTVFGDQFVREIATADLDGDGDLDVAAIDEADHDTDLIRIYRNNGSGKLADAGIVPWGDGLTLNTRAITIGDLDGDGDQDLTWLIESYSTQDVVIALNNGDGTFATPTSRRLGVVYSGQMTLADVDGDGDLDQIVGNEYDVNPGSTADDFNVAISRNNGDATFAAATIVTMAALTGPVAAADFNGDGDIDLVGGGEESSSGGQDTGDVAVRLGNGDGTFGARTFLFTGHQHGDFAVVDFEADGDLDIASNAFEDGVALYTNDGTATFDATALPGGYTDVVGIAAGDITGDALADLVVAHGESTDAGVHVGFGDGTFEGQQLRYGLRRWVSDVELVDLNGDGLLDLVTASNSRSAVDKDTTEAADAGPDAPALGVLVLTNRSAACTIQGTAGDDVLTGTRGTDVICGLGGNDVIKGKGGGDIIRGGPGNDRLVGAAGVDVIDGEDGNDKIIGGADDDRLRGSAGADDLKGGAGQDVLDLLDQTSGNDNGNGGKARNHCRGDDGDTLQKCR